MLMVTWLAGRGPKGPFLLLVPGPLFHAGLVRPKINAV